MVPSGVKLKQICVIKINRRKKDYMICVLTFGISPLSRIEIYFTLVNQIIEGYSLGLGCP